MTPGFKVVFPAPPPTTNDLTPQQRTQLVRKTKKIEQLLGTAPRLVDASHRPIHISFFDHLQQRKDKGRRSSLDSTSSGSSSGSLSPNQRSFSLSSTIHPINSKTGSNGYYSGIHASGETFQSCTFDKTAPLLRLAMGSMTLEPIPASPPPTQGSFSDPPPMHSKEAPFVLTAQDPPSQYPSPVLRPRAPSLNSLRKQKMDIIRKRLGSDVPFDLVFTITKVRDRSENTPPRNGFREKERLPTLRMPRKHTTARIRTSRDSISDAASIHRARRQARAIDELKKKESEFDPSPSESRKFTQTLSSIIESPDEHRFSRFSGNFDFAFCAPSTTKENDLASWTFQWTERHASDSDECSIPPSLCPLSTPSECSPSESSLTASDSPTTPTSPDSLDTLPSPSLSPSTTTTQAITSQVKKRPASYRKPPPPIPVDCC